jgi:hypothetical protein
MLLDVFDEVIVLMFVSPSSWHARTTHLDTPSTQTFALRETVKEREPTKLVFSCYIDFWLFMCLLFLFNGCSGVLETWFVDDGVL